MYGCRPCTAFSCASTRQPISPVNRKKTNQATNYNKKAKKAHPDEGLQALHRLFIGVHPAALLQRCQAGAVEGQKLSPPLGQPAGGMAGVPSRVGLPGLRAQTKNL
jgi:hypothetical protein